MKYSYTINNKLITNGNGKLLIKAEAIDPYNPLNLPPNTFRVRTNDGQPPINGRYDTATLVEGTTDVYDVYKSSDNFTYLLTNSFNLIEVLGANTSNVNNMEGLFYYCKNLTLIALFDTSKVTNMRDMFGRTKINTVPLFNTSNVTDMAGMFLECNELTLIPLFNTSSATNMDNMFFNTRYIESGALALYQQASTQANVPGHIGTFGNCGSLTQTGSAELAQIPLDWK